MNSKNLRNQVNISHTINQNKSYSYLYEVPKMDDVELQTFVRDYLDGCIFTTYALVSYKFPLNPLIKDIFDPISKGALSKMPSIQSRLIGHIYEYFVLEDPTYHVVYDQMELPFFRSFKLIHVQDWRKAKLLMAGQRSIHDNKLVIDLNEDNNKDNKDNSALYRLI